MIFGNGLAACYDLEGKRQWLKLVEHPTAAYGHGASPVLVGDKLLVHFSDLVALNGSPEGRPRYVYGFVKSGPPDLTAKDRLPTDYDPSRRDTTHLAVVGAPPRYDATRMTTIQSGRRPLTPADLPAETFVERDRFLIGAVGDLDEDGTESLDVWTIDEKKNLRNLTNDCRLWW